MRSGSVGLMVGLRSLALNFQFALVGHLEYGGDTNDARCESKGRLRRGH